MPLAYLDPFAGRDDLLGPNLFSAHIEFLEKQLYEDRWPDETTVLIAQSPSDNGLFAIERVQDGIYAMCKLGTWVTINTLERLQIVPRSLTRPRERQSLEQPRLWGDKWWDTAAIGFEPKSKFGPSLDLGAEKNRGVHLCLQMPQQEASTPAQNTQEIAPSISQGQIEQTSDDMVAEAAQSPEEVLKMVRTQYQISLYASKARLPFCATITLHC